MAGRKGYADEIKTKAIIDLSVGIIKRALQDEELPLQFRAEIASRFALKIIPSADNQAVQYFNVNLNAQLSELESGDLRKLIEIGRSGALQKGTARANQERITLDTHEVRPASAIHPELCSKDSDSEDRAENQ